jgi:hypothetical protein
VIVRAGSLAIVVCAAGCGRDAPRPAAVRPVDVAVTDANTAVVMSDGTVLVWGHARRGAVGWLDRRDVAVPVRAELPAATEIVGGGFGKSSTFCARAGAEWWCWGDAGRLPKGGALRWERFATDDGRVNAPRRIDGFAGVKQLRLGPMIGSTPGAGCAILADDRLVCWTGDWSEVLAEPGPVTDVAVAQRNACALARDGRVWCWGTATYGAVDGVPTAEASVVERPVVVPGVTGATAVALGEDLSCARVATDAIACWGAAFYGQGVVRVPVSAGGTLLAGGADVCDLSANGRITCLNHRPPYWCPYGIDGRGQKCETGVKGYPAPPWRTVEAAWPRDVAWGREHVCAITTNDELECSGKNDHGELGDGTLVDRPVSLVVGGLAAPAADPAEPVAAARSRRAHRWDQLPPGCVHDEALAGSPRPLAVVSAWSSPDASLIVLRDYPSGVSDDDVRGDEHELKIDLTVPAPITTATIPFAASAGDGPSALGVLRASDIDVGWFTSGTIAIDVHTDAWVCGVIDAANDNATVALRGRFAAEVAP